MRTFASLFTRRQLVALMTFSDLVQAARERVRLDASTVGLPPDDRPLTEGGSGATAHAGAVATYFGLGIDKIVDYNCCLVTWITQRDQAGHALTKQALPMVWDFAEVNPLVGAAGDLTVSLAGISKVIESSTTHLPGAATQLDATAAVNELQAPTICTDPPYYDNIGYADLSDFFYIWLRRSLVGILPSLFATLLTPKAQELIASPYRYEGDKDKAQAFFEEGFGKAFTKMRQLEAIEYPLTVFYAFKQSESDDDDGGESDADSSPTVSTGWETMLTGLMRAGFSIHGTWPMRTERVTRSIGIGTNALASSIVLVCRPRPADAPLATRKQFITALRQELPDALRNLQHGNIAPVDLAQAAIGPGMAVFTRFAKVMETDGSAMTVRTALGLINQALDEVLAEQEGEFDPDTRWALAWFEQHGMDEGQFGVAETLSKAKNTAVNALEEAGIVKARAGKVRLVKRAEMDDDWEPAAGGQLTVWETTQHLIRALDKEGESGAAALIRKLGGTAEVARDLAYRLYTICERKKWAEEALAYNGLVIAWPELAKLALAERGEATRPGELGY
jgi:putative DNA methylase